MLLVKHAVINVVACCRWQAQWQAVSTGPLSTAATYSYLQTCCIDSAVKDVLLSFADGKFQQTVSTKLQTCN